MINGNLCGKDSTDKVCCTDADSGDRFGEINIPVNHPTVPSVTEAAVTYVPDITAKPPPVTVKPSAPPVNQNNLGLFPTPGDNECGLHFPNKVHGGSVAALDEHPWLARLEYTHCK